MLNDGIEIATFIGIPKKIIIIAVIGLMTLGATAYCTYEATCAYQEHKSNLKDLNEVLQLQRQMSIDMALLQSDINIRLTANEEAINNLSIATQRISCEEMDLISDLIKYNSPLMRLLEEKRKNIIQSEKDYLPHLNGFKIGVTPKK